MMQLKGFLTESPCIYPEKIVNTCKSALVGPEADESLVAFSSSSLFWMSRNGTFSRISALLTPMLVRASGPARALSLSLSLHSSLGKARQLLEHSHALQHLHELGEVWGLWSPSFQQAITETAKACCGTRKTIGYLLCTKTWVLICVQLQTPSDLRETMNNGV